MSGTVERMRFEPCGFVAPDRCRLVLLPIRWPAPEQRAVLQLSDAPRYNLLWHHQVPVSSTIPRLAMGWL